MSDIEMCPECNVPRQFIDSHLWLGGGTTVQSSDQNHRMVLIECANLDPLFKGIEELIGIPIEHIVIETKRRATRDYLNKMIPREVKDLIQKLEMDVAPLIEAVNITGHVMGYGDSSLVKIRYRNEAEDYVIERVAEPYSVPLWCGDLAGSSEAVTDRDQDVKYEFVSPGLLEIRAWPAPRSKELQERLQLKEYGYIEGDVALERCSTCGGPAALSGYVWDTQRGVIEMKARDRRVAMLGPAYLEVMFDELERELGEEIPRVVVEAQRRFMGGDLYSPEETGKEEEFRDLLALRGLGNLREMTMDSRGLRVRIQNVAIHLMVTGLIQGYFEDVTGLESNVEWELKEDGTLELEITPKNKL